MSPLEIAHLVSRTPFAWPGGYELFAITDDGGVLCWQCCEREELIIALSNRGDGWHVVAYDHTGNCDMDTESCDHCGRTIYDPPSEG